MEIHCAQSIDKTTYSGGAKIIDRVTSELHGSFIVRRKVTNEVIGVAERGTAGNRSVTKGHGRRN